ncbi:MAG: cellobiose phosphorylase [Clostridia bacterium]|nr:cellobiose phosphorylase [Clostridia bacterium]
MEQYRLEGKRFYVKDFDKKPPFTSFLPGLAGVHGVPLWTFYSNRGQGITSFGIHSKEHNIMEFEPANISYENTALKGFRTLVRVNGTYFEPFVSYATSGVQRNMVIQQNSFTVEEINENFGLKTTVDYYIMPHEDYGALVREVTFENISDKDMQLEAIDGMSRIIPYGIDYTDFSTMANLLRSWSDVQNIEAGIPIFAARASTENTSKVTLTKGGYFYLSFDENGIKPTVYDPLTVFSYDTALMMPRTFIDGGLQSVLDQKQYFVNKICCAMSPVKTNLKAGGKYALHTLIGYTDSAEYINQKAKEIMAEGYLSRKRAEADALTDELTADIATQTGDSLFDRYFGQCYLDNFLRGGYPFVFEKNGVKSVIHLFSRKHGDPERDYNSFATAGEFYSQGNGHYRDVCQNRRNDTLFHPEVGDFNIVNFFSLLCPDGYNPLDVCGSTFTVRPENQDKLNELIKNCATKGADTLKELCKGNFTPGGIINGIYRSDVKLNVNDDDFLADLLSLSQQNLEAVSDDGFWSDHWDYNLDLIEAYLKVFPDRLEDMLFNNRTYRYFDHGYFVLPRSEKYMLNGDKVRQYGMRVKDEGKLRFGYKDGKTNWTKTADGKIYETDLAEKLISLIVNKFALLDPMGMGIEMEAGKPGWCDAMNGLPGLFGSSVAETQELARLITFMIDVCEQFGDRTVTVPKELYVFAEKLAKALQNKELSDFEYWDVTSTAREAYREDVRYTFSGEFAAVTLSDFGALCEKMLCKVNDGVEKAVELCNGLCPTYFAYTAVDYQVVTDENGNPVPSHYDASMPKVKVNRFEPMFIPAFLEGPAKYLRVTKDHAKAKGIYDSIRNSNIFDKKLKMYKVSESLEPMSMEAGRIRVFTPGWFENEAVFTHMEYKYLLAMLESGLYDEFFSDLKNVFNPFMDPAVYGRSILECSSYIVTSCNPDESLHGRGFVSRLSGSTTEVLSMWAMMFLGEKPFICNEKGELCMHIKPILPGWLFDENGEITFALLSRSTVTLHNPEKRNTYNDATVKYMVVDGERIEGDVLCGDKVYDIRNGKPCKIDLYF